MISRCRETMSIFLCFMLNASTVQLFTYIQNDTLPNVGMCHARVWACNRYRHLPSCSLIPQAVRIIVITYCSVTRCPEKRLWLSWDSILYRILLTLNYVFYLPWITYFTYLELRIFLTLNYVFYLPWITYFTYLEWRILLTLNTLRHILVFCSGWRMSEFLLI